MQNQSSQKPYSVNIQSTDPYAAFIRRFIVTEFAPLAKNNGHETLDLVTDAIIASGQVRYGPVPSPESLVAMREVIRHWMGLSMPIPFMSPWGSEKPDGSGQIDIAELGAVKTLTCLNRRVQAVYPPGVKFSLRVEDLGAPHLFFERMDAARKEAKFYTDGLINLIKVLGLNTFIIISPDSNICDETTFNTLADSILPTMERHLQNIEDPAPISDLMEMGWNKPVAPETIDHYISGYTKMYPEKDMCAKLHVLARYFAGSLARKKLNMTGLLPGWEKHHLEIYFGKTPPGLLPSHYLRRIHYRTLPCSLTTNHIAPWRSKGYLRIADSGVTAALASYRAPNDYNPFRVELEKDGLKQVIQSDYVVL